MESGKSRQYTVRGVPPDMDRALRERSRRERCSLNELVLRALRSFVGVPPVPEEHHDLDDLAGTWVDDPAFDEALEEQNRTDENLWR